MRNDQLHAQKAREAPCGHPQSAGQVGRLYAIRERGTSLCYVHLVDAFIKFFPSSLFIAGRS
jgi:hypothetical protein